MIALPYDCQAPAARLETLEARHVVITDFPVNEHEARFAAMLSGASGKVIFDWAA